MGLAGELSLLSAYDCDDAWRSVQFGDEAPGDPRAADTADPDGDGLNNLAEYTLGLEALVPNGGEWQAAVVAGTRYVDLAYRRHRGASGVVISYESSPDLVVWSAADVVSVDVESLPAQLESVVVRVAAPGRSLFLRIRMQRPVP